MTRYDRPRCAIFVGEVSTTIPGESTPICLSCPVSTYSFDPNVHCDMCPSAGVCPGGPILYAQDGYWASAYNSTEIHKCPRKNACMYASLQDHMLFTLFGGKSV